MLLIAPSLTAAPTKIETIDFATDYDDQHTPKASTKNSQ